MEFLRSKSLVILEYLLGLNYSDSAIVKRFYELASQPVDAYQLTSWRDLLREAEAMSKLFRQVPGFSEIALKALLAERFPNEPYSTTLKMMKKVLKRGKINSKAEADAVNQFLGDTMEGDELFDRLEELGMMLNNFKPNSKKSPNL